MACKIFIFYSECDMFYYSDKLLDNIFGVEVEIHSGQYHRTQSARPLILPLQINHFTIFYLVCQNTFPHVYCFFFFLRPLFQLLYRWIIIGLAGAGISRRIARIPIHILKCFHFFIRITELRLYPVKRIRPFTGHVQINHLSR